jgi:hypothetical protein
MVTSSNVMAEIMFTVYAVLCVFHAFPSLFLTRKPLFRYGKCKEKMGAAEKKVLCRFFTIKFELNVKKNELLLSLQKHTKRISLLVPSEQRKCF